MCLQIRTFTPCAADGDCDWVETDTPLQDGRWYATNQRMPDGSQAVIGGRSCDTVEYVPSSGGPVYIPLIANVRLTINSSCSQLHLWLVLESDPCSCKLFLEHANCNNLQQHCILHPASLSSQLAF